MELLVFTHSSNKQNLPNEKVKEKNESIAREQTLNIIQPIFVMKKKTFSKLQIGENIILLEKEQLG